MATEKLIFYHHPCLDGSTAAWAALQAFGHENTVYIGFTHDQDDVILKAVDDYVTDKTTVYFCDIVPPRPILEMLPDKAGKIIIYDHHVSAEKMLKSFAHPKCEIVFDMHRSGAGLTWDMLHPGKPRPFVIELVEAMDLYQTERMGSRQDFFSFAAGMDTLPVNDFKVFAEEFSFLAKADNVGALLALRGQQRRDIYLNRIKTVLADLQYVTLSGLAALEDCEVGFIRGDIRNLGREFWFRFQEFCDRDPKIVMLCRDEPDGKSVAISFRSSPGTDVSCVAEEIGSKYGISGGGHRNAAAARLTKEQFESLVEKWNLPIS